MKTKLSYVQVSRPPVADLPPGTIFMWNGGTYVRLIGPMSYAGTYTTSFNAVDLHSGDVFNFTHEYVVNVVKDPVLHGTVEK